MKSFVICTENQHNYYIKCYEIRERDIKHRYKMDSFGQKSEGKRPQGKHTLKWEYNIKISLK
jgi:hypothetical protein